MTHHPIRALLAPTGTGKVIPAELLRPSFYGMLATYYFGLALYGFTAVLFGISSITHSNSGHFTFYWSVLIAVVSLIAALGVIFSRKLRREWMEVIAACLLVGLMVGYAVSIFSRAISSPEHLSTLASAWLPLIIDVLPIWRLAMIAIEGDLFKNRQKRG